MWGIRYDPQYKYTEKFLSVIEKSRLKVRDRWLQFIKRVNSTNNKYAFKRAGILYDHKFEYNT